jgi:1-acyl-sn-glycerol-3-phosphate acyltransferase
MSALVYDGTFWGTMAAMSLGFSLRTEGMRHVPRTGPALLIANHQSFFDPVLIGLAARRHLSYLARKTLFRHRFLAWYMRMCNGFPIDQEGIGIEGLRVATTLLRDGRAVAVFPEGERSADGVMHPLRPGIHLLLKRAPSPVLTVGIAGAYDAWSRWRRFPTPAPLFLPAARGAIAVSVGRPLEPGPLLQLPRERLLEVLFRELQQTHDRAERLRRKPEGDPGLWEIKEAKPDV